MPERRGGDATVPIYQGPPQSGRGRGGDCGRNRSRFRGGRGGSRGGRGRGFAPIQSPTVFSPDYDPALNERVTEIENFIITSSSGQKRVPYDTRMPQRPGFGTQGRKVMLWANSFPLVLKSDVQLYRYSINILPGDERSKVPTGKRAKRVVKLLLEDHFHDKKLGIASDFKSNIISTTKLELIEAGYEVLYRGDYEDEYADGAPTYRIYLQATGALHAPDLVNYLTSTGAGALLGAKDEIIQSLNIVLGHTPKAAIGVSSIGSNKHFQLATMEKMDLGAGLTALQGFFF